MTTVSFIIVAYNEEATLHHLLEDITKQDYPHEKIEVILVDGLSTDHTKRIMESFSEEKNGFERVVILDNPKKILPAGWNVALEKVKNDIVIRVDAHSSIPENFISQNVRCIEEGENICGGYRPNIIDEKTAWKETLLLAEQSMFGSSIASYRRNQEKRYVKSIFHGAYKKSVFDRVGKYDERLSRTEDNEMHYRMKRAGYKICFDPSIISYQHTRNTLKRMLRQKYLNGYWIGRTLWVYPKCFSIFHLVPLCFVLGILTTSVLAAAGFPLLSILMWVLYGGMALLMSGTAILKNKGFNWSSLLLPVLFLFMHVGYGAGTVAGLSRKMREENES